MKVVSPAPISVATPVLRPAISKYRSIGPCGGDCAATWAIG